jgi:hypothetical protein
LLNSTPDAVKELKSVMQVQACSYEKKKEEGEEFRVIKKAKRHI